MLKQNLLFFKTVLTLTVYTFYQTTQAAIPVVIDFNYDHGTVLADQYLNSTIGDFDYGVSISATGGPNTAIVYDSELGGVNGGTFDGGDDDLERLGDGRTSWAAGSNLGVNHNAGGLLIVQENPAQTTNPTYNGGSITSASLFDPDDRANKGSDSIITFDLDESQGYNYFQLNFADFETDSFELTLYGFNADGSVNTTTALEIYSLAEFGVSPTGDSTVSALPESFNSSTFTGETLARVELNLFEESGAISQITFGTIPEPSSVMLISLGLGSLALRRRRKT